MPDWTILIIPAGAHRTRRLVLPAMAVQGAWVGAGILGILLGYFALDYRHLSHLRTAYRDLDREHQNLKGEAALLVDQLDDVKTSLRRVDDLTIKVSELVNFRIKTVSRETGIGPLSPEESVKAASKEENPSSHLSRRLPLALNINQLKFQPVFQKIERIDQDARLQARHLQHLLLTLTEQQSLLSSIPTMSPVNGWITSDYGHRVSPFTGKRALHRGVDIAAPIGTPILAPADGVVIFSGRKDGYGNFIMVAHHGYGIVTRYGHNAQNMVATGQKIKRGDQIASVGMSGRTTGPHLHYEVWIDGQSVSPRKFMLESKEAVALL